MLTNYLTGFVYFIFYLFALCGSWYRVGRIVSAMWKQAGKTRPKSFVLQTGMLGLLETTAYFLILLIGFTQQEKSSSFSSLLPIGAWLTIKSFPSVWEKKFGQPDTEEISNTKGDGDKSWPGQKYNIYLIGTLLSLYNALIFASLARALASNFGIEILLICNLIVIIYFIFTNAAISFIRNYSQ